jgi:hypothetical protein
MNYNICIFCAGILTGYTIASRVMEHEFKLIILDKLNKCERNIEDLQSFRLTLYEKNLFVEARREWDETSTETSIHDSEEEI